MKKRYVLVDRIRALVILLIAYLVVLVPFFLSGPVTKDILITISVVLTFQIVQAILILYGCEKEEDYKKSAKVKS